jgi:hypothetical protein
MRDLLTFTALLLAAALAPAPAQTPKNSGPTTLFSTAAPAPQTATTVSVPIKDGDPATVTGTLALHTRAGQQILVIESPTPYRLLLPPGHLGTPAKIIRDIAFILPGQTAVIAPFAGRTVTAVGKLHIDPNSTTSWNGATLESTTVLLPGGKQLHAKH